MRSRAVIGTAIQGLRRNLMRALLTTLGIVIGIAAVIVMIEIGRGASTAIEKTILSMGANNLLIVPGTAASGGVSFGMGSVLTLTVEDAEAVRKEAPAVREVAPVVRARTQVVYRSRNWVPLHIQGTTPQFLDVRDWAIAEGAMFTERDVRNNNKVCVIGQTLARELFAGESPIGKELRVQNVSMRVTGVLSFKGANMMGMDQDDILIAPWTTIKYRIANSPNSSAAQTTTAGAAGGSSVALFAGGAPQLYPETDESARRRYANIDQILASARSQQEIDAAIQQITALLRERHRLRDGEPDDFAIRNMTEMTSALTSTSKLMTRLLLAVALISLIVGGVGIMNIMLVSVTERTREIGIRLAVGARRREVLSQFLAEAVILCLAGGAFGILLGRGVSLLVESLLRWPIEASLPAILAAVSVSGGVGVIFGFYPAWKASRMNPVEALRYE